MGDVLSYIRHHKQAFFLASLLSLLVGHQFFPQGSQRLVVFALVVLNMLLGLLLIEGKAKWIKYGFYLMLLLTIARAIGEQLSHSLFIDRTGELLSFIYLISVSAILFHDLYHDRDFGVASIYAVFSGFILIAVAFGFILMFINNIYPHSLNGVGSEAPLSEYIYFSLITLMTIGYGDIAPATELSRSVVIFASLIGHFYTVFITAIIIGRLITNQTHEKAI